MESPVERYLRYAEELVVTGQRPTLDLLVAHLGGSRTTAHKALTEFWGERLPLLLAAREQETDLPAAVIEAMGTLWRTAKREATTTAESAMQGERDAVRHRQDALDAALAEVAAEREQHTILRSMLEERVAAAEAELTGTRGRLQDTTDALQSTERALAGVRAALGAKDAQLAAAAEAMAAAQAEAERERERAAAELDRVTKDAMASAERMRADVAAERESAARAHSAAMAELKAAYLDSETALRLELDGAKTRLAHTEKARDAARQEAARLAGEVAGLKERVVAAEAVKSKWRRPGIRRTGSAVGGRKP